MSEVQRGVESGAIGLKEVLLLCIDDSFKVVEDVNHCAVILRFLSEKSFFFSHSNPLFLLGLLDSVEGAIVEALSTDMMQY